MPKARVTRDNESNLDLTHKGTIRSWYVKSRFNPFLIGNVPPAEFEMMYYRQLEESAMVAWLKQLGLR